MAVQNHLHDFAHTQSGMACILAGCTAVITQAEVASNKVANQQPDFNHIYKKAGH